MIVPARLLLAAKADNAKTLALPHHGRQPVEFIEEADFCADRQ